MEIDGIRFNRCIPRYVSTSLLQFKYEFNEINIFWNILKNSTNQNNQFESILHKISKNTIYYSKNRNIHSRINNNTNNSCFRYCSLKIGANSLKHNNNSIFFFVQKRLYNRPWSRPPSYTQSNNFNLGNLHPNRIFVCFFLF